MPSLAILVSAVLVPSCKQIDRQTDRHTDADDRYTDATVVGVSNNTLLSEEYSLRPAFTDVVSCVLADWRRC